MRTVAVVVAILFATASRCQEPSDADVFDGDYEDAPSTEIPGTTSFFIDNKTETTTPEIETTILEEKATESDFQIVEESSVSDFSEEQNDTASINVEKSSDEEVPSTVKNNDKIVDKEPDGDTTKKNETSSTQPPATTKNPPVCPNCTTISTTTTDNSSNDNKKASFFSSFNLNYLYLLLLILPVLGIFIAGYCYCRRRKRKSDGYVEPSVQKSKRLSTPSWVFSEPDFHDEEVTTLEEERKL